MWYAMPVCNAIIISTISRMLRAVAAAVVILTRSLLIVSTHVLRLKTAESFVETSQCTYVTEKSGVVATIRIKQSG